MTKSTRPRGGPEWVFGCDVCDHVLHVGGVDEHVDAELAAAANGWALTPERMLCPACASTT